MAYAHCENEDCEKDKWWLQKPPSEYSSGGPKCPECGTTRVGLGTVEADVPDEEPAEPAGKSPSEAQPARVDDAQPAQTPQTRQQADSGLPQADLEAAEAGSKAANLIASLGGSSPEEKAQTQGRLATAAGSMIANLGQRAAEQKMQNAQRAKESGQDAVQSVEDYIRCPECDSQITDLPPAGQQFRCPSCNALLEST